MKLRWIVGTAPVIFLSVATPVALAHSAPQPPLVHLTRSFTQVSDARAFSGTGTMTLTQAGKTTHVSLSEVLVRHGSGWNFYTRFVFPTGILGEQLQTPTTTCTRQYAQSSTTAIPWICTAMKPHNQLPYVATFLHAQSWQRKGTQSYNGQSCTYYQGRPIASTPSLYAMDLCIDEHHNKLIATITHVHFQGLQQSTTVVLSRLNDSSLLSSIPLPSALAHKDRWA